MTTLLWLKTRQSRREACGLAALNEQRVTPSGDFLATTQRAEPFFCATALSVAYVGHATPHFFRLVAQKNGFRQHDHFLTRQALKVMANPETPNIPTSTVK